MIQCGFTLKNGNRCGKLAVKDGKFCLWHDPDRPRRTQPPVVSKITFEQKQYLKICKITNRLLKDVDNFMKQENTKGLTLDEKRDFNTKLDTLKVFLGKVMADSKAFQGKQDESIYILLDE